MHMHMHDHEQKYYILNIKLADNKIVVYFNSVRLTFPKRVLKLKYEACM